MKISILILALLTIISSKAQDIRDTLQGEYIGIRKHYGPGVNGLEYTEKDTIYVYKATLPNKIHIRYLRYTTEQEYLDYETSYPQNLYFLKSDSSCSSENSLYFQNGFFYKKDSLYLSDYLRNGDGISDRYFVKKKSDISIGLLENPIIKLDVFPNPTNDIINVVGNYRGDFLIYDTFGKIVLVSPSTKKINLSNLPTGVYYLAVNKNILKILKR